MKKVPYTVHLQTRPISRVFGDDVPDDVLTYLERDAAIAGPVVDSSAVTRTIGATLSVDATDLGRALVVATEAFGRALVRSGITSAHLGEAKVEYDAGDDRSRDEIVNAAEVARRLGVSRERVRQLAADPRRFPATAGNIRGSKAWRWGDVANWIEAGGRRRTGRPKRDNTIDLMEALKQSAEREHRASAPPPRRRTTVRA